MCVVTVVKKQLLTQHQLIALIKFALIKSHQVLTMVWKVAAVKSRCKHDNF